MTSSTDKPNQSEQDTDSARPKSRRRGWVLFVAVRRFFGVTVFSNLTRRIVFLNLAALTALVFGILYLNQWRAGLIDARVQSLHIQGEIISAAIAASATVDSDLITVNPDRLLQFQADAAVSPLSFFDPTLEFPISPERVAPLLRNLVTPTKTRARIYDKQGLLILDSNNLYVSGEVIAGRSAPVQEDFVLVSWWNRMMRWVPGNSFSIYQEYGPDEGKRYPEVNAALTGGAADLVRVDSQGQLVISVAVPVQRLRAIVGVLLLSTEPGDIDNIVAAERLGIIRIALVAALVSTILSFFLAGTIAGPIRRLSAAAERAGTVMGVRAEIPDFTDRSDEIGGLSGALRSMTAALYDRIAATERFAADVSHELKNPLTSLRSAVETLPLVKTAKDRERLTNIIQHDVRRLDRLISDISNASRLDAELARDTGETVDMAKLTETMISVQEDTAAKRDIKITYTENTKRYAPNVRGHDGRFAQVVNNLIDNAVSFSPDGTQVEVKLTTDANTVVLTVSDQGPGISGDAEKIFDRFYTDRPESQGFGNHSGLGLSISKQIVDAHRGKITATNRKGQDGAVFSVTLPREKT